jgi:hypothetical protein
LDNYVTFAQEIQKFRITLLVQSQSSCFIGGKCHLYDKSNGLTLEDILRDEIQPNMPLNNQSFTVKISAALTIIMFVAGVINSVLSWLIFQNEELRKVGCVMYLLASSITSLLTISMFTVKFWFVVLTQMNVSVSLYVLQGGCVSIEPILKLFVYLDAWLNACVAVERAFNVAKGVNFDRAKSKRIARWIILILPFCIMASIIHEPLYRQFFVSKTNTDMINTDMTNTDKTIANATQQYTTQQNTAQENTEENYALCLTHYSHSVQQYSTFIQFFHLVLPFIANLFSALFIIFGVARQRSTAQTEQSYRKHVHNQLKAHKQLMISPLILLALSSPRLIIALLPGCVNVSRNLWLFLCGYFISFTPSMLVFIIFVLPSDMYRKKFKELLRSWRRETHQ